MKKSKVIAFLLALLCAVEIGVFTFCAIDVANEIELVVEFDGEEESETTKEKEVYFFSKYNVDLYPCSQSVLHRFYSKQSLYSFLFLDEMENPPETLC